jgi:hypothetical protein
MAKANRPAFDDERRTEYLAEIRGGSNSVQAADTLEVPFAQVEAALTDGPFRDALQAAEEEAIRAALYEGALAGNIPAIQLYMSRYTDRKLAGPSLSPDAAEVRRLAQSIAPLLVGD